MWYVKKSFSKKHDDKAVVHIISGTTLSYHDNKFGFGPVQKMRKRKEERERERERERECVWEKK